jgi:hypothetical protein
VAKGVAAGARTLRPDDVRHVAHRRAGCGAEVEHLDARCDVDVVEAREHRGRELAAERVPQAVLCLVALVLRHTNIFHYVAAWYEPEACSGGSEGECVLAQVRGVG